MTVARSASKEAGESKRVWRERVWRERDEAWERMEAEYPRVKAEHPDKWVAFGKDGFITANDDLFALVDDYKEKGYTGRQVLIRFMHVSTTSHWGELA